MARTFGAPLTVPAGKVARMRSKAFLSSDNFPKTSDTICITWEYRSMVMYSAARILPISQTRPMSLRARSTNIKCSAFSFSSARSSSSKNLSSCDVFPRGRVPAIGRIRTSPSCNRTCTSGEAPTIEKSSPSKRNM